MEILNKVICKLFHHNYQGCYNEIGDIEPFCSRCGNAPARKNVRGIPGLQEQNKYNSRDGY